MSVQIQEFLENKKLPSFLSNNKTLKSFGKVHKVFPGIGLPNCKEDCVLDNTQFIKESARLFVNAVSTIIYEAYPRLTNYATYFPSKRVSPEKLAKIVNTGLLVYNTWLTVAGSAVNYLVIEADGKISIKLYRDILNPTDPPNQPTVAFKTGESLFRVYNKLYTAISELKCGVRIEKLDTMPEFKIFSSNNLPSNKFQIVFSSEGAGGLWDIATMSMRGISSCQSWKGQYKQNLIGSIVDPFVGIIYLTSGQDVDGLGSKMVKRSIVRFVVNAEKKKSFIAIDRMYPSYDKNVIDLFLAFIKQRVGDLDVVYAYDYENMAQIIKQSYIPYSEGAHDIKDSNLSYRDTKIPFKWQFNKSPSVLEKNISTKQTKFRNYLFNTSFQSVKKIKAEESVSEFINNTSFPYLLRDYYKDVAEKIIELGPDLEEFSNSKDYMKRLCFFYLNNKHLTKGVKTSFVRKLNKYFKKKVDSKNLFKALDVVQDQIDAKIKTEMKKCFSKKISVAKLPN